MCVYKNVTVAQGTNKIVANWKVLLYAQKLAKWRFLYSFPARVASVVWLVARLLPSSEAALIRPSSTYNFNQVVKPKFHQVWLRFRHNHLGLVLRLVWFGSSSGKYNRQVPVWFNTLDYAR